MGAPVYKKPLPKYRAHDILKILLNPQIDLERITTVRPTQVTNHSLKIVQYAQGGWWVDMCACSPGQSTSPAQYM